MNSTLNDVTVTPIRPSLFLEFLQQWRLIRNCLLLGMLVAIATVLALGRTYTATVSFAPQGASSGQLRGLAAQFGFDISGSQDAESPYFYVELGRTKDLLTRVVTQHFEANDTAGDYATFVGLTTTDSALRSDKAIIALEKRLSVSVDRRTGIVTVAVTERNPQLSLQLASAMLAEIERYNLVSRQTRAGAERRFVETRLAAARTELKVSEDSLQKFLIRNREFRSSPELTFEYDRLNRSVTEHGGVVSSLAQNFEQTRIDEVRDTPVISIVQPPQLPARPNSRGWGRAIALALGCGLLLALLIHLAFGGLSRLRVDRPNEYEAWTAALHDIRRNILRV